LNEHNVTRLTPLRLWYGMACECINVTRTQLQTSSLYTAWRHRGSKQCVHVMVLGVCGSNSIHTD